MPSGSRSDYTARALGVVGALVGIISLTVSLIMAYRTDARSQDAERQQFIRETYETFLEINHLQMQQPEIAHEFVRPRDYNDEVGLVKRAFSSLTPEEKGRLHLREEAFAYYLFSAFERLAYETRAPESTRSEELGRFLDQQLRYFGQFILPNPRLVYYWRDTHGCEYYDFDTRRKYAILVPNLGDLPSDPEGPFADTTASIALPANRHAAAKRCLYPSEKIR
jgi:hypothetical protein